MFDHPGQLSQLHNIVHLRHSCSASSFSWPTPDEVEFLHSQLASLQLQIAEQEEEHGNSSYEEGNV